MGDYDDQGLRQELTACQHFLVDSEIDSMFLISPQQMLHQSCCEGKINKFSEVCTVQLKLI